MPDITAPEAAPIIAMDADQISFSIVIPVYNRAASVLPTLESVRSQSHARFTCLVVDDGSRDGEDLRAVVEGMKDPRFRYIWQLNGGGGAARTTGILASDGDFVALLDSDDTFMPDKLAIVARHISAEPQIDVWAHLASMERGEGVSIVRPTRLPRDGESVADMMFRDREFMQTSTLVIRTHLAKDVRFDPRLRKAQDVDFMIRLERAGARLRCIPQVLSIWNDAPADNRVGAPRRPENVLMWYREQKPHFASRTRYAFESTYLAYEIAEKTPLKAAAYIGRAFLTGAVGAKVSALTAARAFIDQHRYRIIVDKLLKIRKNK
jgi:glycosyltransferase involved in cell wall biosynthesis